MSDNNPKRTTYQASDAIRYLMEITSNSSVLNEERVGTLAHRFLKEYLNKYETLVSDLQEKEPSEPLDTLSAFNLRHLSQEISADIISNSFILGLKKFLKENTPRRRKSKVNEAFSFAKHFATGDLKMIQRFFSAMSKLFACYELLKPNINFGKVPPKFISALIDAELNDLFPQTTLTEKLLLKTAKAPTETKLSGHIVLARIPGTVVDAADELRNMYELTANGTETFEDFLERANTSGLHVDFPAPIISQFYRSPGCDVAESANINNRVIRSTGILPAGTNVTCTVVVPIRGAGGRSEVTHIAKPMR